MSVHDFTVKDASQNDVTLDRYRGQVALIVNTATRCGLTPQYAELQELHSTYKDRGFTVLDFPCNQFKSQAPEIDAEIQEFCQLNYGTTFQTFAKLDVNGSQAHPLFQYLKEQIPQDQELTESGAVQKTATAAPDASDSGEIKWNFTKFLVTAGGDVVARYAPTVPPKQIAAAIEELLTD